MDTFVIYFRVRTEKTFILVFSNIHVIFIINRRTRFENQVFKSLLHLTNKTKQTLGRFRNTFKALNCIDLRIKKVFFSLVEYAIKKFIFKVTQFRSSVCHSWLSV